MKPFYIFISWFKPSDFNRPIKELKLVLMTAMDGAGTDFNRPIKELKQRVEHLYFQQVINFNRPIKELKHQ